MRTILAGAVDLARSALVDLEPTGVGAHLGVRAEDECSATHRFEATLPGYHGWQWAVVVAAAPGTDRVTVSESALLPGPDALIAPEFVPWEQRIRPGDLAPGDLLAPPADDPRLAPGYTATGDPEVDETAPEVGLGRKQVLSREGRADAAERWYAEYGPDTEMAKAAPGSCASCGFYLPLAGALRACFGVCANAMGADGHVVHMGYGCGAHSDTQLPTGAGSPIYQAYDDAAVEVVAVPPKSPEPGPGSEAAAEADIAPDAVVPGQAVVAAPPVSGAEPAPGSRTAAEAVRPAGDDTTESATGPAVEATAGPVAEPVGESSPESAVVSAVQPVGESGPVPVAESSTEPGGEPGTGPVAGAAPGPAVEAAREPVASPPAETTAEAAAAPTAETTGEPVAEPGTEPAEDPAGAAAHPMDTATAGTESADATNEPVEATAAGAGPVATEAAGTPETSVPGAERESAPPAAEPESHPAVTDRTGAPAAGADSAEAGDPASGPADH